MFKRRGGANKPILRASSRFHALSPNRRHNSQQSALHCTVNDSRHSFALQCTVDHINSLSSLILLQKEGKNNNTLFQ